MPLTRRVQVLISEEASEKLDLLLVAHGLGPTALIEVLILRANPLEDLTKPVDSQPDTKQLAEVLKIRREKDPGAPDDIVLPLERKQVVPIPKPGKKNPH